LTYFGSAWIFSQIAFAVYPDFGAAWINISLITKLVFFSLIPMAIFMGIGILILRRNRPFGLGFLFFLVVDLLHSVTMAVLAWVHMD
jgi:hypothetical protein